MATDKEPKTLRDLDYLKPDKFRDHLTILELSLYVGRSESWLKNLERKGKIPKAARVQQGQLAIRLWSPVQVKEIVAILAKQKVGRPVGS